MTKKKDNNVVVWGAALVAGLLFFAKKGSAASGSGGGAPTKPTPTPFPSPITSTINEQGESGWIRSMYNNALAAASAAQNITGTNKSAISPVFILAQAALESNFGQSPLAKASNNMFGIKADVSWKGQTYNGYRAYNSVADSFADYIAFLESNKNYASLWSLGTNDPQTWAEAISSTGYSTDPQYGVKLSQLIPVINQVIYGGTQTQGLAMTPAARQFISNKIEQLINEGYEPVQAEAIAYEEARKKRFKV